MRRRPSTAVLAMTRSGSLQHFRRDWHSEARCNGGGMMMIIPIGTAVARPAHTTVMIGLAATATKMTGTAGVGGMRETAAAGVRAMITTTPGGAVGTRETAAAGATATITTAPGGAAG